MKVSRSVNSVRRKITKRLTAAFAKTRTYDPGNWDGDTIIRILICRPNARLGNLILLTPLVQEVAARFPAARIDLFTAGNAASKIFRNYEQVELILQLLTRPFRNLLLYSRCWLRLRSRRYDLVINAVQGSSSGRLATMLARGRYKFFGDESDYYKFTASDYSHAGKYPIYNFMGFLNRMGCSVEGYEMPMPDIMLDADELAQGEAVLKEIAGTGKPVICLFTNATEDKSCSN
jgi:ADP-heptose:LPS heptosyltransferase